MMGIQFNRSPNVTRNKFQFSLLVEILPLAGSVTINVNSPFAWLGKVTRSQNTDYVHNVYGTKSNIVSVCVHQALVFLLTLVTRATSQNTASYKS